jgi:hypothetical protein
VRAALLVTEEPLICGAAVKSHGDVQHILWCDGGLSYDDVARRGGWVSRNGSRRHRSCPTAASIWITAAIGILAGIGFNSAVIITTLLALGTLSVFRWIETRLPTLLYAHHQVRFRREAILPEERLRELLVAHGFSIANLSYRLNGEGQFFGRSVLATRATRTRWRGR